MPRVALVGAPNVGKSTLFNRLLGGKRSLVHSRPGMTRDRVAAPVAIGDLVFELVDTGGTLPDADRELERQITGQAMEAARGSDLVLVVVDGRLGPSPVDQHLVDALRPGEAPTLIVVNKLDEPELLSAAADFYRLGAEEVVAISAEHGLGMDDLERAILERLPSAPGDRGGTDEEIAVGLVGRPNVGKSSLLNRLLNEDRVLVSATPGTTRDAVDTVLRAHGCLFRLVDTAGLRRHRRAASDAESLAMGRARAMLARVDIAVLVMDASSGITTGDIAVAGLALARGRAVLPVINKWDLVQDRSASTKAFRRDCAAQLKFLPDPEALTVSAQTGLRVRRILSESRAIYEQFSARRPTSVWNQALRAALAERRPPMAGRRPFRFYYAVQTGTRPPELDLFVNTERRLPEAYHRFLERQLRARAQLDRTPLRLTLRPRSGARRRRRGRARA